MTYYVSVTNATCNGVDSVRINYIICEGIQDNSLISNINVYPNPAIDDLNISFTSQKSTTLKLEIFNIQGVRLFASDQIINNGMNNIEVNLPDLNLSKGFYLLRFSTKEFNLTKSLILD